MTLEFREETGGQILVVRVRGMLSKNDYLHFVLETERLIKLFGKIRVMFELHDFYGWEMTGVWKDLNHDLQHFKDIDRLAIVGETAWEHGMAVFCRPFTTARIQYFDLSKGVEASNWIHDGIAQLA